MLQVRNAPQLSLSDCIQHAVNLVPALATVKVISIVSEAVKISKLLNSKGAMADEEAAAIYLYTDETPIYPTLNKALRENDTSVISAFLPYLRLLLSALHKLPLEKIVVYRGVNIDLHTHYREGSYIIWWPFSSTSTEIAVAAKFHGTTGARTRLRIQAHAVDIRAYSKYRNSENERLVLPCTRLLVNSWTDIGGGLHECELEVVKIGAPLTDYPHPMFFCDVG